MLLCWWFGWQERTRGVKPEHGLKKCKANKKPTRKTLWGHFEIKNTATASYNFLCTAIRQVHLVMNKPESVHTVVKRWLQTEINIFWATSQIFLQPVNQMFLSVSQVHQWMHLPWRVEQWAGNKYHNLLNHNNITIRNMWCGKGSQIKWKPWLWSSRAESRAITLKSVHVLCLTQR